MTEEAEVDVLVAGGGAAGVAAAVGAARAGGRVVLVERQGFLGGMATAALVGTVCGLYLRRTDGPPAWAVGGFARAFAERLATRSDTAATGWKQGLWFLPYDPWAFRTLCDEVLAEAGVEVWLHSTVVGADVDGDRVRSVRLLAWDRLRTVRVGAAIDTTGTAFLSTACGVSTVEDETPQAPAYVVALAGLPILDPSALALGLPTAMARAVAAGTLPPAARALSIVPGTIRGDRAYLKLGLPGPLAPDPSAVSAREQEARALVSRVVAHLRSAVSGFERVVVTDAATQLGVRTGRRPLGRAVLSDDDVLQARTPPDGVAAGAWPAEHWGADPRPVLTCFAEGAAYTIPVGALRSSELDNLWMAGRITSATPLAIASARVVGTCLQTGYASGTLAMGSIRGEAQAVTVEGLRESQLVERV